MAEYTDRYGALTSIVDNTTKINFTDSTGTDFLFEVMPINITEEEINKTLTVNNIKKAWFIDYTTSIRKPTENDIKKALTDGLIISVYIDCQIIDNYGTIHIVEYDKIEKKYVIRLNAQLRQISLNTSPDIICPLSNELINKCKSSIYKKQFSNLTIINRILYADIYGEFIKLKETIKVLEDKIKILEQK